ncbi:hypothetical protein Scep_025923 [Stephania cephalantha]|uniref:Uncharacterized protein n=1 Tax=Stephania cephalantha TaxID=152367 RepID=A0AAP0HPT8_9MAGN
MGKKFDYFDCLVTRFSYGLNLSTGIASLLIPVANQDEGAYLANHIHHHSSPICPSYLFPSLGYGFATKVKRSARLNSWRKNTENGVFTCSDRMPNSLPRSTRCTLTWSKLKSCGFDPINELLDDVTSSEASYKEMVEPPLVDNDQNEGKKEPDEELEPNYMSDVHDSTTNEEEAEKEVNEEHIKKKSNEPYEESKEDQTLVYFSSYTKCDFKSNLNNEERVRFQENGTGNLVVRKLSSISKMGRKSRVVNRDDPIWIFSSSSRRSCSPSSRFRFALPLPNRTSASSSSPHLLDAPAPYLLDFDSHFLFQIEHPPHLLTPSSTAFHLDVDLTSSLSLVLHLCRPHHLRLSSVVIFVLPQPSSQKKRAKQEIFTEEASEQSKRSSRKKRTSKAGNLWRLSLQAIWAWKHGLDKMNDMGRMAGNMVLEAWA